MKAKDSLMKLRKRESWTMLAAAALLAMGVLAGCSNLLSPAIGSTAHLFAVDSKNGKVYEINDEAFTAASTALVSIGQNAAGEIAFSGDVGFIAVGSYGNTSPGLYYFDASSATPVVQMAGSTKTSAQYLCIVSDKVGYVTTADYAAIYPNAVYPFDPSNPQAGLGAAVAGFPAGFYPQDIVYASGRVYVADNGNGKVCRLNAAGTAVDAIYATTAGGTTGLLAGSFNGDAGVFVANSGGYDAFWNSLPGSIDFISSTALDGATATSVLAGYSVGRLAAFDSDTLAATTYSKTYIVELSGAGASASEVTCSSLSFGSNDVNILGNYAYVPDGANALYRFSASGADARKIAVGQTGEYISNVGLRP